MAPPKSILKVRKINEYEVFISYKEFEVKVGNIDYKVIKKNSDIQVFKKLERSSMNDIYQELSIKEVDSFLRKLDSKNLERRRVDSVIFDPSLEDEDILDEEDFETLVDGLK